MKFLLAIVMGLSLQVAAQAQNPLDLAMEIQEINRDFNGALGYPVFVVNKPQFQQFLAKNNITDFDNRVLVARALYAFVKQNHHVEMQPDEAMSLANFFAPSFKEASAMPFFVDKMRFSSMKYCVVIPSEGGGSVLEEIKRMTGADSQPELYAGVDLEKLAKLFTRDELQLFSLYHELSHCLDQNYIWSINEFEVVPHNVHLFESFAETNALLLLAQRKGLKSLGASRSILRAVYSKYYGPAIAKIDANVFAGAVNRAGGSVYFLPTVLLATQKQIDTNFESIAAMKLTDTLALSKSIVENHALDKASFEVLNMLMVNGSDETLAYCQRMAAKKPSKFLKPYLDLLYYKSILDGVGNL
jgi:hypothetical protein